MSDDLGLVEVARVGGSPHAEELRGLLESNGIPAVVSGEGVSSAYPLTVGPMGGARVLVRAEDEGAARELLASAFAGELEVDGESEGDG
jgi:hypothetical protein